MRLKTIATAVTVVVVGFVVTAIAIVSTMDFNQYRGTIAAQVKQATGRDLTIKGDLKLALGLSPAIAVSDVSFANAPWGSRPNMVEVKRFKAQVALLPLVFGNIIVKRLVLNDADILLETDKQGHGNWEFAATAAQEATKPKQPQEKAATKLPEVHEVDIRNARVSYRDGKTSQTTKLALSRATLGADGTNDPLKLDVDGAFNDLAFQVAGRVGSIQAMSQPGTPFPININGRFADAVTFKVDGVIREPLTVKGYELTVAAEGGEISRLARIGGMNMTPVGPFKIEAKIADSAPRGNPSLPTFEAEFGEVDFVLVRAEGAVLDPIGQKGLNVSVSAEGREIGAFAGFGVPGLAAPLPPIPALGPFKAMVHVTSGQGDRPSVPQLKAELGAPDLLKLNVDGAIQDPLGREGINVNIVAEAAELRAVAQKAGVDAPISGPFSLMAKVTDTGLDRYALSGVKLKAGDSDLAGDATLAMSGARPTITASFASIQVDLAAFTALEDAKTKPAAPSALGQGGGAKSERMFSDDPLPFDLLNASDGELHYKVGKLLAKGTIIGNLDMNAAWRNGEFHLRPLTADIGGGKIAVDVGANARNQSIASKIEGKGINLGPLLEKMEITKVIHDGKTDMNIDVRGAGKSMHALMASLDGNSTLHVGEGEIESAYADLLGADVVRVLSPLQGNAAQTKLNCAVSRYEIKDGVATSKVSLIDTGRMTVVGEGTVNLGSEQLDLQFTPRPKDAALVSLAVPIHVGGTLTNPSFSPDTGAALRDAAGAIAGTLLLGPAGAVLPFISGGQHSQQDPCTQALAAVGLRGTAPAPSSQQQQQPSPDNPANAIGRGLRGLFGK